MANLICLSRVLLIIDLFFTTTMATDTFQMSLTGPGFECRHRKERRIAPRLSWMWTMTVISIFS